jgi:hypothetical protein
VSALFPEIINGLFQSLLKGDFRLPVEKFLCKGYIGLPLERIILRKGREDQF